MNVQGDARDRPGAGEADGMLLDTVLPRHHFAERHSRVIAAPPEVVWEGIESVTLGEMPIVAALFRLRSLPGRISGRRSLPRLGDQPVLAQLPESGFVPLAEVRGRELVFGLIDQMWKLRGERAEIKDAAEFVAFDRAGFVKAAMNFRLSNRSGGTLLETETRVFATDPAARRGFGRYWLLIRPASGLIRRLWLRAIARRARQAAKGRIPTSVA